MDSEKNAEYLENAWQRLDRRIDRLKIEKENRKPAYLSKHFWIKELNFLKAIDFKDFYQEAK